MIWRKNATKSPHARTVRAGHKKAALAFATEMLEQRLLMDSKVIADVPYYPWYYGCTPTVIGEIMGYYNQHGFANMFPGSKATTRDAIVSNLIASTQHQVAGLENGRLTYDGKTVGAGDWQNCTSYPNHQQNPDCIADFIKSVGGEVYESNIIPGMTNFLAYRGYTGWSFNITSYSDAGFQDIVTAINQNRPVMAIVDLLGEGRAAHSAPIVGYNTANNTIAVVDQSVQGTRDPKLQYVQWFPWHPVEVGKLFGVLDYIQITAPGPYLGLPGAAVPGTIQAENFDTGLEGQAYHDTDAGNTGGFYRNTGVDIGANTADAGYHVGWTQPGEWLNYTVNVTDAGLYSFSARVASLGVGATFHLEVDGVDKTGSLSVPDTGGWQAFQNVNKSGIFLTMGQHVLKLVMDNPGSSGFVANFDSFTFTGAPAGTEAPFYAAPQAVPGTIQAADYDTGGEAVGYHDTDTANLGGQYRGNGVDIENCLDTGGGYDVAFTKAGEWMRYTVKVASTGTYNLGVRVASLYAGGTFHLEVDGVNATGAMAIPNTGGFQSWQTITKAGVAMTAGQHILRLVFDSNGASGFVGNFHWLQLTRASTTPIPPTGLVVTPIVPGRIDLLWTDNSDNETGFIIERKIVGVPYVLLANVPAATTFYGDKTVTAGTQYQYRVRAKNALGESTNSISLVVTALAAGKIPAAPSALAATAVLMNKVSLSWTDNSNNETGFIIERKAAGGSYAAIATVGENVTSGATLHYDDTTVVAGTSYTYRITAANPLGSSAYTAELPVSVPLPTSTPYTGAATAMPGLIEAENFDNGGEGLAYHDSDPANTGGRYRNEGVDIGAATDTGGGFYVGWTVAGEWMDYTINATAGTYELRARVASGVNGGTFHVQIDGTDVTGPMVVPNTGDFQAWQTIASPSFALTAGQHVMTVVMDVNGDIGSVGNFNWFRIAPPGMTIPAAPTVLTASAPLPTQVVLGWTDNSTNESNFIIERKTGSGDYAFLANAPAGASSYTDNTTLANTSYTYRVRAANAAGESDNTNEAPVTTPAPISTPLGGTPAVVPGQIEVENFDDGGEGLAYHDSTAGNTGGQYRATDVDIQTSNDIGGGYAVAYTKAGEWLNYTVNVASNGNYTLDTRLACAGTGGTFHLAVDGVNVTGTITVANTLVWTTWQTVTSVPFALTAGRHVLTLAMDTNGASGYVGNFNWMRLNLLASAPPAAPTGLSAIAPVYNQVNLSWTDNSDNESGFVIERKTGSGSYSVLTTAPAGATTFTDSTVAGSTSYTYRVKATNSAGPSAYTNEFPITTPVRASTPFSGTPIATPGQIEAENYDLGGEGVAYHDAETANLGGKYRTTEGVDIEASSDTGGGYDVAFTRVGEWMNYTTTVSATGTYTLDFRVAAGSAGGAFHLEVDGLNVTGTMSVPNTGGWQTWQTVSKTGVSLASGQHTLRLVMDTAGASGYVGNFNWTKLTQTA